MFLTLGKTLQTYAIESSTKYQNHDWSPASSLWSVRVGSFSLRVTVQDTPSGLLVTFLDSKLVGSNESIGRMTAFCVISRNQNRL